MTINWAILVPIITALIAAVPIYLGVQATRRAGKADATARANEQAVAGFVSLVNELQEEREACQQELRKVRVENAEQWEQISLLQMRIKGLEAKLDGARSDR